MSMGMGLHHLQSIKMEGAPAVAFTIVFQCYAWNLLNGNLLNRKYGPDYLSYCSCLTSDFHEG